MMKFCTECGQAKSPSEFSPHDTTADRRRPDCKVCRAAYVMQWKADNPEAVRRSERRTRAKRAASRPPGWVPTREGKKRCPRCEEAKPVIEFHQSRSQCDGRDTCCKSCARTRDKVRRAVKHRGHDQ